MQNSVTIQLKTTQFCFTLDNILGKLCQHFSRFGVPRAAAFMLSSAVTAAACAALLLAGGAPAPAVLAAAFGAE